MRWKLAIQEFDFQIRHIPGEENEVADALSRIPEEMPLERQEREFLMLIEAF